MSFKSSEVSHVWYFSSWFGDLEVHFGGLGCTAKQETPDKWSLALWKPSVENFPAQLLFIFITLQLKMTFPPANAYFLVLIKYGALECILHWMESKLTEDWGHLPMPCIWGLIFHKRSQSVKEADAVENCLKKTLLFPETRSHTRVQLLLINVSVSLLSHLAYHAMDLHCQCSLCGSQPPCPKVKHLY